MAGRLSSKQQHRQAVGLAKRTREQMRQVPAHRLVQYRDDVAERMRWLIEDNPHLGLAHRDGYLAGLPTVSREEIDFLRGEHLLPELRVTLGDVLSSFWWDLCAWWGGLWRGSR